MLARHPSVISEENQTLIEGGLAPVVDPKWLEYHPEHEAFIGDFLRHHHIDRGPIAAGIPRRFHEIFHSGLHYAN